MTTIDNKEEIKIEKDILPLVRQSNEIEISSGEDLQNSVEILSRLNQTRDRVIEDKEKMTKPINTALKEIRAKYKPIEEMLDGAISAIRNEQSRYHTLEMKKSKEEEKAIADKMASGEVDVNEAIQELSTINTVGQKVSSSSGSVSFREVQTLKITDINLIPREYMVVDEKLLLSALKEGKVIPGSEIEIISQSINRR